MTSYLLTIDIGTTSTKAFAFLPDGSILGKHHKGYPTHYPHKGYAEQDPHEILSAVKESIQNVIDKVEGHSLAGISFSCAMHSLMVVDRAGEPLTPLLIWADNRSEPQATKLKASELGHQIYNACGTPIHAMAPLCKLLWLRESNAALVAQAHKLISIKEYIFHALTGNYVVDYSIASATGLFDTPLLNWHTEALALCGIRVEQLSTPCPPERIFFPSAIMAAQLKLPVETPFIVGASDGCLANLGSGVNEPGEMAITIGTSGAVRMSVNRFKTDGHQRTFCYFLAENVYIVGGASNNGAVLLNWFSEQIALKSETPEEFLATAFSVESTEGLIFLPYLQGERAPIYDSHARGNYFGISMNHTQVHFRRALVEGICFEVKSIVESVEEMVMPAGKILVSGGFIKSEEWVQLLCDVIGKPLIMDGSTDASSVGAAILGFKALAIPQAFKTQPVYTFYPDSVRHHQYEKVFQIFKSLYMALKSEFPKLNN